MHWRPIGKLAEHMMEVMADSEASPTPRVRWVSRQSRSRPVTKFEQRGERLGHGVWDLLFIANNE